MKRVSKKNQILLDQQKQVKQEAFDFDRISLYFRNKPQQDAQQVISDRIIEDLDLDELFISLDRTSSIPGQQLLYDRLRVVAPDDRWIKKDQRIIDHLHQHPELQRKAILELSTLNKTSAYYLQRLFFGASVDRPGWFWVLPVLSVGLVALLLASLWKVQFFLGAIVLITVNVLIHLWNKNNVMSYSNAIPQLLRLIRVSERLLSHQLFPETDESVRDSLRSVKSIKRSAVFFKWESRTLDEIAQVAEFLIDLIKGVLLIEPLMFYRLMDHISVNKSSIRLLFEEVAQLDVALSIMTWRTGLPYYASPVYAEGSQKTWNAKAMYHPLIIEPVANDFSIKDEKSVLLSGSNMAGKTTFIRTIGINALLAQTLGTVCAKSLLLARYKLYTAIRISDDLQNESSYYLEEIQAIHELVAQSSKAHPHLFLLDEVFKGTNTIERIAAGKAVLSFLTSTSNFVCCSTHDLELMEFLKNEYSYYHFSGTAENGQQLFDYLLKQGGLTTTNAIPLLAQNGFPDAITEEATRLAEQLITAKKKALS